MDLIEIINDNYSINVKKIEKNEDSTDGNVYILKSTCKYVLKIYDDENHTLSMCSLHEFLSDNNFNVPNIIKTKNNASYLNIDNKYFVIYTFLSGNQLSSLEKINSDVIEKYAKELRRFHDTTSKNNYKLGSVSFCNYNNSRLSVLHFDLTKDNIFIDFDKIGFIDFDDAKYGPSVCDVALTIALLFLSKKRGIDKSAIKTFIDSYYSDDLILRKKEIKLIKKYAIDWINCVLNGHEFDPSTNESFEVKKKLLEENKDLFM